MQTRAEVLVVLFELNEIDETYDTKPKGGVPRKLEGPSKLSLPQGEAE